MDQTIKCKECKNNFVFTESEQEFFKKLIREKKMSEFIPPKRCKKCRHTRKHKQSLKTNKK